jgi:hypothetical protein
MALYRPPRKTSVTRDRWGKWQAQERQAVLIRSGRRCEGCGQGDRVLQWAHIAGRRHIVGEPWASSRELTAALCCASAVSGELGCHEKYDRHLDEVLIWNLGLIAVDRLWWRFCGADPFAKTYANPDPLDSIRSLVTLLERTHSYDPQSNRVVAL